MLQQSGGVAAAAAGTTALVQTAGGGARTSSAAAGSPKNFPALFVWGGGCATRYEKMPGGIGAQEKNK